MSSARFEVGLLCAPPTTATGLGGLSSAAAQVTRRLYVFVQHGELDAPPDAAALQMLALMYDAIATEAPCLDLVPLLPAAGWTKERALGLEDIQAVMGVERGDALAASIATHGLAMVDVGRTVEEGGDDAGGEGGSTSSHDAPTMPRAPFQHAAVGGTFDRLHSGHRNLLATAALVCVGTLYVGIAGDELLRAKANASFIEPFDAREAAVLAFLHAVRPSLHVVTKGLLNADPPLASTMEAMEGLIISRETVAGGASIQRYREEHGFPPLQLVVVDLIGASSQAADAQKLSSSALRQAAADEAT